LAQAIWVSYQRVLCARSAAIVMMPGKVLALATGAFALGVASADVLGPNSCRDGDAGHCGAVSGPVGKQEVGSENLLLQLGKASEQYSSVPLRTFFWNVHWECSLAARGAKGTCKHRIGRRFAELARESRADIVASVELSDGNSRPASLSKFGLSGWTQVDGPCRKGSGGDAAALAFAPGWHVERSDGGCLRTDYDTRAFAVALVRPPRPVRGCPHLCVVAIHAPHTEINNGRDKVKRVCGEAAERCGVAMGDWNVPAAHVHRLWSQLIGGAAPHSVHPDERTCCFPESNHYGVFDHLATNIPGAVRTGHKVHPYQLLSENPRKQHRAVAAQLSLPGSAALIAQ